MMQHERITPRECDGAKEYAKLRLEEKEHPMSPKELAEEYGCSGSHMRTKLSELNGDDKVESVSFGQYTAPVESEETETTVENAGSQSDDNSVLPDTTDSITDYEIIEPVEETDSITGENVDSQSDDESGESMREYANSPDEPVTPTVLPANPRKLLVVFVVVIGLYLLYQNLDSNETSTPSESEPDEIETTGGLIQ